MPDQAPDTKTFPEIIRELDRGRLQSELEEKLTDVVEAVLESGKAGNLKLEIRVKKAGGGDSNQLLLDAKVTTKEPQVEKPTTLYFADGENHLMRRDPRQFEMELKAVQPQSIRNTQ